MSIKDLEEFRGALKEIPYTALKLESEYGINQRIIMKYLPNFIIIIPVQTKFIFQYYT